MLRICGIRSRFRGSAGTSGAVAYASFPQELTTAARVAQLRGEGRGGLLLVGVGTVAAMALALIGVLVSLRRRIGWILLTTLAYFYAIEFVSFAEARHLLPLVPLYILFAAVGLLTIIPVIQDWLNETAKLQQERDEARGERS